MRENRERVKSFLQAYGEMIFRLTTDKSKAMAVYRKGHRLQDHPSVLEQTYNYYKQRLSFPPRAVRGEGMQLALQMIAMKA